MSPGRSARARSLVIGVIVCAATLLAGACSVRVGSAPRATDADALMQQGVAAARGRTGDARQRAAALFEQAAALYARRGFDERHGIALLTAATLHFQLGRSDRAMPLADSALVVLRPSGRPLQIVDVQTLLGELHQLRGNSVSALAAFRAAANALDAHDAHAARASEAPPKEYVERLRARLLSDMGNTFTELGLPDSARAYLTRGIATHRQLRDTLGFAVALNNLGRLQQTLGRPDSARRLFGAARVIMRDSADHAGEATVLTNVGYSFDLERRPDSAIAYHREALTAARKAQHEALLGVTLINLGRNHVARGEPRAERSRDASFAAAADDLQAGLAVKRSLRDSAGMAWALHDLGRLALARGERDSAIARLERSRALFRRGADPVREASAVLYLARANAAEGPGRDLTQSFAMFSEAHTLRSEVGLQVGTDADRITFNEQDRELTEEWARAWLLRPDMDRRARALGALAVADLGRGRALLRLLRAPVEARASPADLVAHGERGARAASRSTSGAALYYLVTRDTLWIWVIDPSSAATAVPVRIGRDSLATLTSAVRTMLEERNGGDAIRAGASRFDVALRALSDALVPRAVRERIPPAGELLIFPQGELNLVPFAALPIGSSGEPLGVRHALRFSPSLDLLAEAERLPAVCCTVPRLEDPRLRSVVIVGNPAMPTLSLMGLTDYRPSQLDWADSSSRRIAQLLHVERLSGASASEEALRRRLAESRASIIHLETHGFAYQSEADAQSSFVVLASSAPRGGPAHRTDGMLTVGEILDDLPDLTTELVVLSACETGLGSLQQAEGTVGLQRAFLAKKARSVLVSLWRVDDRASAQLMESFYRHWLGGAGTSKADALRRAQIEVRGAGRRDPYYWAAFQLVGAG